MPRKHCLWTNKSWGTRSFWGRKSSEQKRSSYPPKAVHLRGCGYWTCPLDSTKSEVKRYDLFDYCTFFLSRLLNTGLQAKVLITREYISNNLERKFPDENKNARWCSENRHYLNRLFLRMTFVIWPLLSTFLDQLTPFQRSISAPAEMFTKEWLKMVY